jgi:hypothetical protein
MRGGQRDGVRRPRGAKNKRTAAVEAAMQVVAAKFKDAMPEAFDGDGVAYLQTVYRDPALPVSVRVDAAAKSARYERPALAATLTRDVTPEGPVVHKLALDYSLLEPHEMVQFAR